MALYRFPGPQIRIVEVHVGKSDARIRYLTFRPCELSGTNTEIVRLKSSLVEPYEYARGAFRLSHLGPHGAKKRNRSEPWVEPWFDL